LLISFSLSFDVKALFEKTLKVIEEETLSLKILGIYKGGSYKSTEINDNNIHKN